MQAEAGESGFSRLWAGAKWLGLAVFNLFYTCMAGQPYNPAEAAADREMQAKQRAERDLRAGGPAQKIGPPPVDVRGLEYASRLGTFRYGQVCVVEAFGTHCPACKSGAPGVAALAKKYREVYVVGVCHEGMEEIRAMIAECPAMREYNVGRDPSGSLNAEMQAHGVSTIPHAFVYDRGGRLVWHGGVQDSALRRCLDGLIASGEGSGGEGSDWAGRGRRL